MNLKKQLRAYSHEIQSSPREEHLIQTIERSEDIFFAAEQSSFLSYPEILRFQLRFIRKRWWLLQLGLLLGLWTLLLLIHEEMYTQRCMGAAASLFVILLMPELWKNRSSQSMEVEGASYYSLRQIYAARMLIFGVVDILFITLFCQAASRWLYYDLSQLLVQFLFPMSVTACICFHTLHSRHIRSESFAIVLCLIWSFIWLLVLLNEAVYTLISLSLWFAMSGLVLCYLSISVYRAICSCNTYWEVDLDEIEL